VLALVVERRPPASSEQQALASMLQASGGIRRALQASAGHCSVRLQPEHPDEDSVAQFCTWLPAHAGLVKCLDITPVKGCCTCSNTWGRVLAAAFQQCTPPAPSATQRAAVTIRPQGAVTRSRAAAAAAAAAKPPQLPLALVEFTASRALGPAATELAAALPSRGLTRLQLHACDADSRALLSPSIAALTGLRHLSLEGVAWPELAQDIGGLRLTHLTLQGLRLSAVSALPISLHTLVLEVVEEEGGSAPSGNARTPGPATGAAMPPACLSLGHLSRLRGLSLETYLPGRYSPEGGPLVGLQLPAVAPLTRLGLEGDSLALGAGLRGLPLSRRTALQHLDLQGAITLDSSLPELLRSMLGLQDVRLVGDAAWDESVRVHAPQMAPLVAALGSLTQLTSLVLAYFDMSMGGNEWQAGDDGIEWGESLCGLTSLRKLHLCFPLFTDDTDHLTDLAALSDLRLDDCGFGVDDEEFDIVCSSFPNLVSLMVGFGGLTCSSCFLVSAARLTGLTGLLLPGHYEAHLHVEDLEELHRLTRLQELVLPHLCRNYLSPEHVKELTDTCPSLHTVEFW
jgi:hypothetical protein